MLSSKKRCPPEGRQVADVQGAGAVLFQEGGRDLEDEPTCAQRMLGFSGDCNKERPFHVKLAFKTRDCPWYDLGFCKHGEAQEMWGCLRQGRDAPS